MNAPSDSTFWLVLLALAAVVTVIAGAGLALYVTSRMLQWFARAFIAVAPAPYGRWIVGIAKFYYVAVPFCGLTAFGVSLVILGAPFPETVGDPVLRNPLLWLTWLAVTAGIMIVGATVGLLLRGAIARARDKLAGKS